MAPIRGSAPSPSRRTAYVVRHIGELKRPALSGSAARIRRCGGISHATRLAAARGQGEGLTGPAWPAG